MQEMHCSFSFNNTSSKIFFKFTLSDFFYFVYTVKSRVEARLDY